MVFRMDCLVAGAQVARDNKGDRGHENHETGQHHDGHLSVGHILHAHVFGFAPRALRAEPFRAHPVEIIALGEARPVGAAVRPRVDRGRFPELRVAPLLDGEDRFRRRFGRARPGEFEVTFRRQFVLRSGDFRPRRGLLRAGQRACREENGGGQKPLWGGEADRCAGGKEREDPAMKAGGAPCVNR